MAQTPIKALVISISDTRHKDDDVSGVTLIGLLLGIKAEVHEKIIVSDDLVEIKDALMTNSARDDVNLIITTGGTGFSRRDNTPGSPKAVSECFEVVKPVLAHAVDLLAGRGKHS